MIKITPRPRPSLLLECGPNLLGTFSRGRNAERLLARVWEEKNVDLRLLVYTREEKLPHTNRHVGGTYIDTKDVEALYRSLNESGFPFNLALNGSPDYSRHTPLFTKEEQYLDRLQNSGVKAGLRNVVTVADNALLPALRKDFPGLDVTASCIAASFEPNLVAFRDDYGVEFSDPQFLIKYYTHLYSQYDQVVPTQQLATPAFLSALDLPSAALVRQTILFMNLGCGSPLLGRCCEHYQGRKNSSRPGLPEIPAAFLVRKEDRRDNEPTTICSQSYDSLALLNRSRDLRAILSLGIDQFKVPARSTKTSEVLDFLCDFVTQDGAADSFPERPKIFGYSPAVMKLSFEKNYPPLVHGVLREFNWPREDSDWTEGYNGHAANSIQEELHARALALWEKQPPLAPGHD